MPKIDAWAAAAKRVRKDMIVLCHGGPIAEPADAEYILRECREVHGFYGASSMERLPTERALTETDPQVQGDRDHPQDARKEKTMTGAQFGSFILGLVVVAIVVAIGVWLLHWLYLRSSKERAFVRTGLGGQKVVLNGGAFVLPIVHDVLPVNMNTLRLEVSRGRDKALITKDRMRVDVTAEFYVRVQATVDAIASAAQTLGQRTLQPESLKELLEGKFVDALRTVAAELTMEELHEKRGEYVKRVRDAVAGDLLNNGLELESASLTQLDQTSMEFFNPSNAFDAEGLTRLTEQIERRKKQRNDIEQDTLIQIRNKNLEAEKMSLDIDRDCENARLAQERELEIARAAQRSELARERAEHEQQAERAQITAREQIERARIATDRTLEEDRIAKEREIQALEIERRQHLEIAEQQRAIAVAGQSRAQSEAQAEADLRPRPVGHRGGEGLHRARDRGGRAPPPDRAHRRAPGSRARGAARPERRRGREGGRRRPGRGGEGRGAGRGRRREDPRARRQDPRRGRGRGRAPDERGAQHPVAAGARLGAAHAAAGEGRGHRAREREADGAHRGHQDPAHRRPRRRRRRGAATAARAAGMADNVVNSALRYRAQAPLVDMLLKEIGVQGGDIGKGRAACSPRPGAALPGDRPKAAKAD